MASEGVQLDVKTYRIILNEASSREIIEFSFSYLPTNLNVIDGTPPGQIGLIHYVNRGVLKFFVQCSILNK